MRFLSAWIPPWIPIKAWICARYDCSERRLLGRRYCQPHADLWDAIHRRRFEFAASDNLLPMVDDDD